MKWPFHSRNCPTPLPCSMYESVAAAEGGGRVPTIIEPFRPLTPQAPQSGFIWLEVYWLEPGGIIAGVLEQATHRGNIRKACCLKPLVSLVPIWCVRCATGDEVLPGVTLETPQPETYDLLPTEG